MDWVRHRYFNFEDERIVCTEMDSSSTHQYGGTQDSYCLAKAIEYIEELEIKLGVPNRRSGEHLVERFESQNDA